MLDYSSIIWDPYLTHDIEKLERVQRQAAHFINWDYHSREEGSVTKMLETLELETLERRRSSCRLVFLFKVVEGLVPANRKNYGIHLTVKGRANLGHL